MRTDEQFTSDLSQAMHATTEDLRYAGAVPKPSRPILVVAPVAVAGIAGVALAVAASSSGGHPARAAQGGTSPTPVSTSPTHSVTLGRETTRQIDIHKLKLAGYSRGYQVANGHQFYARIVDAVPSSATSAPDDAPGVSAYVGVDPTTGFETAYVKNGDQITAVTSPQATETQLKAMLEGGAPQAVPLVGADN